MKLTERSHKLIFDLCELEPVDHRFLLIGVGAELRKNLLTLYRLSSNPESHNLIVQIMAEGGYPWFEAIAQPKKPEMQPSVESTQGNASADLLAVDHMVVDLIAVDEYTALSESDFLDVLPVNALIH